MITFVFWCIGLWLLLNVINHQLLVSAIDMNPYSNRDPTHNSSVLTENVANPCNNQHCHRARPNLIIVMVDQLNLRTLGCYRRHANNSNVWGPDIIVETPNIDALARQGLIFSNFYTVSPLCTPSRASFLTGMYPSATGAHSNSLPFFDNVTTLGHVLQQNGYFTAYLGKWHLNGEAAPGWGPEFQKSFGFHNVTYQYNRGGASKVVLPRTNSSGLFDMYSFDEHIPDLGLGHTIANQTNYITDFLVQKTIDIISQYSSEKPFAILLSIPDPHPPYNVRAPYDTLYKDLKFQVPTTMKQTLENETQPNWAYSHKNGSSQVLKRIFRRQKALQQYFGMIKCIDDNMGKLFQFVESDNTMVVFTSDHGALLGEHALITKGKPYKTSAGVPFILKYPTWIPSDTVIDTPTASIDLAPTLFSLLNISVDYGANSYMHGQDLSREWIEGSSSNRTIFLMSSQNDWFAAVDRYYKIVLSTSDIPWLFDLTKDPDEMINMFGDPFYHDIATALKQKLLDHIQKFKPQIYNSNHSSLITM